MKSNYKRLGDYIVPVKVRNSELKAKELLGININKYFMSSVANIVGTDLSNYKLVQKNQFACNRMHVGRDYRIPVAVSETEESFMVSPAYDVFEVMDNKVLLPEYLMMWFERAEFDRNAWFYTDADVRGGLAWQAFEDMQLPIPHIDKQREIVKEYNTIQNRISLNQQLIQKLEETAQAIYKQWFVEFEFPDENRKPYKSNGGEMVWNEELQKEIPLGWKLKSLRNIVAIVDNRGKTPPCVEYKTEYPLIEIGAISGDNRVIDIDKCEKYVEEEIYNKWFRSGHPRKKDILFSTVGSLAEMKLYWEQSGVIAQNIVAFRASDKMALYLYQCLKNNKNDLVAYEIGSVQASIKVSQVIEFDILYPSELVTSYFDNLISTLTNLSNAVYKENQKLTEMKGLLLSKLATIEN